MMTDGEAECSCIVDTDGLHDIATASGNLKTILLEHLKNGLIAVPACALKEFEELYEDEAEELKPFIKTRIFLKKAFYVGAARIADNLNSGFLFTAYNYVLDKYEKELNRDEKRALREELVEGMELSPKVARMCAMNLYLHGIGGDKVVVHSGHDSLAAPWNKEYRREAGHCSAGPIGAQPPLRLKPAGARRRLRRCGYAGCK
jgi:hypothetical protein